jgi:hypothetical protein
MAINDLITVGARPRERHAYWALGGAAYLNENRR